jgi:hypothetical protein
MSLRFVNLLQEARNGSRDAGREKGEADLNEGLTDARMMFVEIIIANINRLW